MAFFRDLLKKWFYQNSSSAASSDARIPLLTATGEPKGSDTMANLVSVLGAIAKAGNVFDALSPEIGIHYLPAGSTNKPSGVASAFRMCVTSKNYPNHLDIFVFDYAKKDVYYTHYENGSGSAVSWKKIATNIPDFYKNYVDLSSLGSALGVRKVFNAGSGYNANTLKINASVLFYTSNIPSAQNLPNNAVYGILECIMYSDGRGLQKYHGLDNINYRKIRKTEDSGNTWGNWSDEP